MNIYLDCIPCFVKQALEAARRVTKDPAVHEQMLREVLSLTAELDLSQCPPVVGQRIHRRLRELTGGGDPYAEAKTRFTRLALELLPEMAARVESAADPFTAAVQLAIAGNVIDLGANGLLTESEVRSSMSELARQPLCGDVEVLRAAAQRAQRILYLADNAGEVVLDRPLITLLGSGRVTVAVRGAPVINDATRADAEAAGLTGLVEVIDNGSDAPGTVLAECSADFRARFSEAELIIAKGQGNFETLSGVEANVFFLFKAKCPVIAGHARLPLGAHAVLPRQASVHNRRVP